MHMRREPLPTTLVVRLRNWVGDVTLSLPLLQRLADAGYGLQLVGKGWAADLLAGHGWPVHKLAPTTRERISQLRSLARTGVGAGSPARTRQPTLDALCLPDSFSSALEFRLAGLRTLGHAWEGRSLLLAQAATRPRGVHELEVYWRLGDALLGAPAPLPRTIDLRPSPNHQQQARALREAHQLEPGFIAICPFAGGTWSGQDKTWPGFAAFVAERLPGLGRRVVICPGPGAEEAVARRDFGSALCLPNVGLGAYAALLQGAALMISNDTGPGHIAAAVGTPLLSVLGPSDARLWRAWGPKVSIVQGRQGWPSADEVEAASRVLLAGG
jgi:heptosyltransferase II